MRVTRLGPLASAWITDKAQMLQQPKSPAERPVRIAWLGGCKKLKGQGSSLNARKQYAAREQQILDRNGGCLGRDPPSGRPVTWSDHRKLFRARRMPCLSLLIPRISVQWRRL